MSNNSNPLDAPRVEARATDTLQAAVRGLINHIQTQGEMDDLLEKFAELR
jgi:hypothetical protein